MVLLLLLQGLPQERLVLMEPLAGRLLLLLPTDPPAHIKKVRITLSSGCVHTCCNNAEQHCPRKKPAGHAVPCNVALCMLAAESVRLCVKCS
jgi:hypothetical protein